MEHSLRKLTYHSSHVFENTKEVRSGTSWLTSGNTPPLSNGFHRMQDHSPGAFPLPLCDGTPIWRTYGTRLGHIGPGTVSSFDLR